MVVLRRRSKGLPDFGAHKAPSESAFTQTGWVKTMFCPPVPLVLDVTTRKGGFFAPPDAVSVNCMLTVNNEAQPWVMQQFRPWPQQRPRRPCATCTTWFWDCRQADEEARSPPVIWAFGSWSAELSAISTIRHQAQKKSRVFPPLSTPQSFFFATWPCFSGRNTSTQDVSHLMVGKQPF